MGEGRTGGREGEREHREENKMRKHSAYNHEGKFMRGEEGEDGKGCWAKYHEGKTQRENL